MDGARANRGGCLRGQRQQLVPTGCASRSKHALNARVHLFLFEKLAASNLVNANLHLRPEPLIMGKQLRDGFLHKLVRSAAGFGREGVKLCFLLLGQMYFHTPLG
jgi:hypothetical protein